MSDFVVKGFRGAAVEAGIKYSGRKDLGMICSDVPSIAAAVFTKNLVKAAPVIDGMNKMLQGPEDMRALVVNSGNANACTGSQGMLDVEHSAILAASESGCRPENVLVASTGVIGVPMPMNAVSAAIPGLVSSLDYSGLMDVAQAMLTTDTKVKTSFKRLNFKANGFNMAGMAKGAGMIAPDMGPPSATMLAFILTDAPVEQGWWQDILTNAVESSFNVITIDGDTSTNDTVYALANGMAFERSLFSEKEDFLEFKSIMNEALSEVCRDLARQIVLDGEGATKCVDITVCGAASVEAAEQIARTVASSPLVKTAFFGNDPNWGRILAAAGRAGVCFNIEKIDLFIEDVKIAGSGMGTGIEMEKAAAEIMKEREFSIRLNLNAGTKEFTILTTDLSDGYVHINADYRT